MGVIISFQYAAIPSSVDGNHALYRRVETTIALLSDIVLIHLNNDLEYLDIGCIAP